jgi:hypothetical protein
MQRLDKEMAAKVVEIVVERLILTTHMLTVNNVVCTTAALADTDTMHAANALWKSVVQNLICARVLKEVEQRKLFPVTVRTLSALICDVLPLYK